jgi:hypothetical protein
VSDRTRLTQHHYVRRSDRHVVTERLLGDASVNFLYSPVRERARWLFEALTSRQVSKLLGVLCFQPGNDSSFSGAAIREPGASPRAVSGDRLC